VHGQHIHRATRADGGRVIPATDALISDAPGLTLMLRFADCLPILIVDPAHHAIGLAHAGWRGAMQNIAGKTVAAMREAFGSAPGDLLVGLGPAIQRCCYQVGEEVITAARQVFPPEAAVLVKQPDQSDHFDLIAANTWQLAQEGVKMVAAAPFCTSCQVAEFYSHRREQGRTGRFAVLLGLR
jgi:YfiH family protein